MSRMNSRTSKKVHKKLAEQFGDVCNFCGRSSTEYQIIVDHRDNDNSNNDMNNLQLLCRRCNNIKNPKGTVDKCVSEPKTELQINRSKEPQFRRHVYEEINKHQSVDPEVLINSGAELLGLSPVTTKRYLDKLCSKSGLCKKIGGKIRWDTEHPLLKGEVKQYDIALSPNKFDES